MYLDSANGYDLYYACRKSFAYHPRFAVHLRALDLDPRSLFSVKIPLAEDGSHDAIPHRPHRPALQPVEAFGLNRTSMLLWVVNQVPLTVHS